MSPLHSSEREFLYLASRAMVFSFFPVAHPEYLTAWRHRSQLPSEQDLVPCAEPAMTRRISGHTVQHPVAAPRTRASLSSHRRLVVASLTIHLPVLRLQPSQLRLGRITQRQDSLRLSAFQQSVPGSGTDPSNKKPGRFGST